MIVSSATSLTLRCPNHAIQKHDLKEIGVVVLHPLDEDLSPDSLLGKGRVGLCNLENVLDVCGFGGVRDRFLGDGAAMGLERCPVLGLGEEMSWIQIPSQLGDFRIAQGGQEWMGNCKQLTVIVPVDVCCGECGN